MTLIRLQRVSFRYSDAFPVFDDIESTSFWPPAGPGLSVRTAAAKAPFFGFFP